MIFHYKYWVILLFVLSFNVGCADSEMKSTTAGLSVINDSTRNKSQVVTTDAKPSTDTSSSDISALALLGTVLMTMADKELGDDKKTGESENASAIDDLNTEADSILSEVNVQKN